MPKDEKGFIPTMQERRATEVRERSIPAKKNKRRWCGGRVGREHVFEWRKWRWYNGLLGGLFEPTTFRWDGSVNTIYWTKTCIICGRQADWETFPVGTDPNTV